MCTPTNTQNLGRIPNHIPVVPMTGTDKLEMNRLVSNYVNLAIVYENLKEQISEKQATLDKAYEIKAQYEAIGNQYLVERDQHLANRDQAIAEAKELRANIERRNQESSMLQKEIAENEKKIMRCAIFVLRQAFDTDEKTIVESIAEEKLKSIPPVVSKRCIAVDDQVMNDVVIPFVLSKKLTKVNLAAFKDELTERALFAFFKALPSTDVQYVSIAKPLSEREMKAKKYMETMLAQRGLVIELK